MCNVCKNKKNRLSLCESLRRLLSIREKSVAKAGKDGMCGATELHFFGKKRAESRTEK